MRPNQQGSAMSITPEAEAPKAGVTVDIQELKRLREFLQANYQMHESASIADWAIEALNRMDIELGMQCHEITSLRKQVYAEKDEALGQRELVAILQGDLSHLRSSRQDDIREAVRLTINMTSEMFTDTDPSGEKVIAEVLSQMEKKK
jgi:hypothetical protein